MTNHPRKDGRRRTLVGEVHVVIDRRAHLVPEVIRNPIEETRIKLTNPAEKDQNAMEVGKEDDHILQNEGREEGIPIKRDVGKADEAEQVEDTRNTGRAPADPSPDAETSREDTQENAT